MKMGFLKNWMLPACLLACASTDAQTLHLKGSIKGCNTEEMDLYVKATECTTVDGLVKLNAEKSRFEGDVPAASDGFYKLFGKHEGAQLVAPSTCRTPIRHTT